MIDRRRRKDYGKCASQYFDDLGEEISPLAKGLRQIILDSLQGATEILKWGYPVYENPGLICSIRASKKYVALQFFEEGIQLCDPGGLLEGTGEKMRHVKIKSPADLNREQFIDWIQQVKSIQAGS